MATITGTEQLPTGTVTLFSDIEGSTRLLSELGGRYGDVLHAHRDLLRGVWRTHRGVEVSTEGDSFFVAFGDRQDAIDAAVAGQRAVRASRQPIRVRMGVHTGVPELHARERDYWGADVHLAARVAAAAHGGQILATGATAGCVAGEFEDLGKWRLKDFERPTRLFQVVVDGESADRAPAPRALDVRPSNLPVPENAMIGREAELHAVARMLSGPSDRLVTRVGLGAPARRAWRSPSPRAARALRRWALPVHA